MQKKILAMLLAAAMLLGMVGCTNTEKKDDGKTLTVWVERTFSDDANNCLKTMLDRYSKETGVKLNVEFINSTDFMTKLNAAVEAGTTPDISTADVRKTLAYYPNNPYLEVNDLLTEIEKENPLYESIYEASEIDGNHYFVPFTSSAELLFVRKDKMEAAGYTEVPDTWDGLFEMAEKMSDPQNSFWGFGQSFGSGDGDFENAVRTMLWNNGGGFFDENGNASAVSNPVNKQILEKLVEMYKNGTIPEGAVSWDASSNNGNYLQGTVGIVVNACTLNGALQSDEAYKELYENTIVTTEPAGSANHNHMAYIYGWGIHKECKNVEGAKDLIKYLCDPNNYQEYVDLLGPTFAPVFEKAGESELWSTGVHKTMVDYVKNSNTYIGEPCHDIETLAVASQVYNAYVFANVMNGVISGNYTVDEALQKIDDAINEARASISGQK